MGLDGRKPSTEAPPPGSGMIDEQLGLPAFDSREDFHPRFFVFLESLGGEALLSVWPHMLRPWYSREVLPMFIYVRFFGGNFGATVSQYGTNHISLTRKGGQYTIASLYLDTIPGG